MSLKRHQLFFALVFAGLFTTGLYLVQQQYERKHAKNKIEQKEIDVSLVVNKNLPPGGQVPKAAVLDFMVTVVWGDKKETTDTELKRNFAFKNREKMEMALLQAGFNLIERSKINKIIKEQNLIKSGLSENNIIEIGRLLNADIVVFGTIPQWSFYRSTDDGYLEIITKGICVDSGAVVFKGTISHHFISTMGRFRYDIALFETEGFKLLGERLGEWLNQSA
jgi:hypothetical protein